MKILIQIPLVVLLITFLLMGILTVSVKVLLLSPSFWQKSFETHNVYGTLAEKLRTQLEDKTVKEGGRRTDAVTLTQLITPENLKSFINRNVTNIL